VTGWALFLAGFGRCVGRYAVGLCHCFIGIVRFALFIGFAFRDDITHAGICKLLQFLDGCFIWVGFKIG
jgi:hypothetical protein